MTRSSPVHRRLRVLAWIVAFAVVFTLGGFAATRFMATPAQRGADASAPPPSVITAPVEKRVIEDSVVTRGDVTVLASVDVLAGRKFSSPLPIVTRADLTAGEQVKAASVVVEIAGRPVFLLPGGLPAYESLSPGSTGPLVKQLQDALRSVGAKIKDPAGTYADSTADAVSHLYTSAGYPSRRDIPMSEVAFVPTLPAQVISTSATRGANASEASLVLAAGSPVVVVKTDSQLTALAQNNAPVRLSNELTGGSADGVLHIRSSQPGSGAGESDADDRTSSGPGADRSAIVVVIPTEPLPLDWVGANVRVRVLRSTTGGPTLAVPLAAVHQDGAGRTVVTVLREGHRTEVEVRVVVTGGGYAGIVGDGIAVGDQVVIGIHV